MTEHPKSRKPKPRTTKKSAVIQEPVTIKITVMDIEDVAIQDVKVAVFLTSDRTKILDTETDASGIASTTYAGPTPAEVEIRCRKAASTNSPRYVNYSCVETIRTETGLDFVVILIKDRNFNKIS
jgi:hypothetical protein